MAASDPGILSDSSSPFPTREGQSVQSGTRSSTSDSSSPFPSREGGAGVRSLIIGLGNPILGDDGVGWRVAEELKRVIAERSLPIEVDSLAVGGLSLMERMVGYDRVVVVDAIRTGAGPIGMVTLFALADLPDPSAGHLASGHDANLHTALAAGRALGVELPEDTRISIVAVEAESVYDFQETLSPAVEAAVSLAVQLALQALG